jgi:hypothetical protein
MPPFILTLSLIGMFTRILFLIGLCTQAHSNYLRLPNPMTTVIPRPQPHVTILPTDIHYEPIPHNEALYHPYLR